MTQLHRPWFGIKSLEIPRPTRFRISTHGMNETEKSGSARFLPILAAMLLAIATRGASMLVGSGSFDDPDNYLPLARSLAAGEGLALGGRLTAYRPPLYPIVLTPLLITLGDQATCGIGLLHLALGAATAGLTAGVALAWNMGARRALIAALIVAFDPVLVWQSRFVMTETLTAFFVIAAVAALTLPGGRGAVLGGCLFGLGGLSRPSLLAGAVLAILAALFVAPGTRRERVIRGAAMALAMGAALAPWAARNTLIFGVPVWTTTHGGYTLALANNEVYYRDVLNGPPGAVWTGDDQWRWWDSVNRATAGMPEPEADRFLRNTVWKLELEQPGTFLRACFSRLARFWSVAPATAVYSPVVRWATALWTVPLWIALVLGLFRRQLWQWPQVAAPLCVIGLTLVHAVYWTDLRMRAPIVPAIALIAAGASLRLGDARTARPYRNAESTAR
jgi:4-amino-4-deoxy-L-arabinose transferase-like glycosyltransferase